MTLFDALFFSVVVWNMATKDSICGASAQAMSAGTTYCLTVANMSDDLFVTGGEYVYKKYFVILLYAKYINFIKKL